MAAVPREPFYELTGQQLVVYRVLQKPRPYPPTVRELASELQLSVSTVHVHLRALREKEYVSWETHKPRTLLTHV